MPADVLEQLAAVGAQGDRQRDRRQVGAAAAERRQLAMGADALEAGDDRHEAIASAARSGRDSTRRTSAPRCAAAVRMPASAPENDRAGMPRAWSPSANSAADSASPVASARSVSRARRESGRVAGLAQRPAAVGQQHARRAEDRVGDALEGADHHDGPQTRPPADARRRPPRRRCPRAGAAPIRRTCRRRSRRMGARHGGEAQAGSPASRADAPRRAAAARHRRRSPAARRGRGCGGRRWGSARRRA